MKKIQQKILIVVSKDIIRRNILDTAFWSNFVSQNNDSQIVLLIEKGKGDYYAQHFAGQNVVIEEYAKPEHNKLRKALLFLCRNGIRSRSTTFHRWHTYKRGRAGYVGTVFKSILSNTVARIGMYKRLLRSLLVRTKSSQEVLRIFDAYQPTLVFAPSLIDADMDIPIALEAKRRGIKIVGMVRSWDNLNHHGLMAVLPDHFIFQNKWLKFAAQKFQAVSMQKVQISVVGLPHYDAYKHPEKLLKDRAEFFESIGLDPQKKLIFLGGSEYYYSEDSLLYWLNDAIEKNKINTPAQVLYRIHPSSIFKVEDLNLSRYKHIILDGAFIDKSKTKFTDADKFINSIYHSDVTINIGSTLSIDASVFDRPAIAVEIDDSKKKLSRWESVHRFNDYFDHQIHMLKTGGVKTPRTPEELIENINDYFQNPALDREGRKRIIEEFVEPFDGKAGERLARVVSQEVSKI